MSQADELSDLSRLVCSYSERYAKDVSNVQIDFSSQWAGDSFQGQAAIHMGVRPYEYPKNGAFMSQCIVQGSGKEYVRVGNPQYSFMLVKRGGNTSYSLEDLVMQSKEESIYSAWKPKSTMHARCISSDCIVVFAPITVANVPTEKLFHEAGIEQKLISSDSDKSVVEFTFPLEHISKHTSAIVSFGKNGEVLESIVYQRRTEVNPDVHGWYTYTVTYSPTEKTISGFPLPQELQLLIRARQGDKTFDADNVYKAYNYRFDDRDIEEFTLTHYGFAEPEGSTVLGRPIPYWLLGTLAGTGFLGLAIYLRKRASKLVVKGDFAL